MSHFPVAQAVLADFLTSLPLPEVGIGVGVVLVLILLAVYLTVRHIPNQEVGVVEKLWSTRGSVPEGKIIALNGDLTLGDSTKISAEGGNIIALASGNVVGGTGMTLTAKAANNGNQNDQGQNDNGQGNNNDQGQNDNSQGDNNNQGENNNGGQGVIVGGGIQIGAGLTSSNELRDLLSTQPAPFRTSPDPLPTIGLNVNNNGTGLVKVEPASGLGITLNNGGSVSTANVNGGVILLQAESGSTVTMNGSTLNTFLPISYTEESPVTERKDELVVDTGEDDPGLFDDEVVASK